MNPYLTIAPSAIVTYSGRMIEPLNPDPSQIELEDIAHSLANQCRFTGHVKEFYSVAQHSVLVSYECAPEDALWGLLHDASEAYLADIARPVKKFTKWGAGYLEAEIVLMHAVGKAFDFTPYKGYYLLPKSVKEADDLLLRTEMRDLMPEGVLDTMPGETLEEEIVCWTPKDAKLAFLERYFEITEG